MAKRFYTIEHSDFSSAASLDYLNQRQVARLEQAFVGWYRCAASDYIRRVRGRYWLAFLFLRFTGARIGEILSVNDATDIDLDRNELRIVNTARGAERFLQRAVPVPEEVIREVATYRSQFPTMRGKVFALDQGNFRRKFYRRAEEAEIPRKLSHPHILRHTRAIELLEAGVPLTMVQDLLGHTLLSTTVIYLKRSKITARTILTDKGLI